jgi:hypothetical protein
MADDRRDTPREPTPIRDDVEKELAEILRRGGRTN